MVLRGTRNVYEVKDKSEKEDVTVMGCFSADGTIVKPQVIFSYERVPASIRADFPPSLHLSCSKTGWMNSDLFV